MLARSRTDISLFAKRPSHFPVPLGEPVAVARSLGQGRPSAGACALPLTAASTAARLHPGGGGLRSHLALLLLIGSIVLGAPGVTLSAHAAPADDPPNSALYADDIAEAAQRFGIPAAWIEAVIRVESDGDRRSLSSKGAMGLMQLMPKNWTEMRARLNLGDDPFDPHDNILAGAALLRELHDRYGAPGFLAAYNAGPRRYEDYRDRHRPLPTETVAYVAKLAPFIAGDITEMASANPLGWTNAPLFVGHPKGAGGADHDAAKSSSDHTSGVVRVSDLSAIAPQSDGLFVALSMRASAP